MSEVETPLTVMLSCGEASGELYAAALARELRAVAPGTRIVAALGGDRLREAGVEVLADYHAISVTGLTEALRVIPRSIALIRQIGAAAERLQPDVFVPIDFPDFHFRLMAAMRRRGIPVAYYISPQLWAWRPGRIRDIARHVAKMLVIFPFEERIYRDAGVDVEFVGHPLLELVTTSAPRAALRARFGAPDGTPLIALLPGSRPNELSAILPDMLRAAVEIRRRVPAARFILARAPKLDEALFAPVGALARELDIAGVADNTDDVLAAADAAVTASGTATVQAALHDCPMVIVYRVSPLTAMLGRRFLKLDTFGMVNLVAGERIVPELIQEQFTPVAVADEIVSLLADSARREAMIAGLRRVKAALGGAGGARRAAEAVVGVARRERARSSRVADAGATLAT